MGKERLKRVLIIIVVALLAVWLLTALNKWQRHQQVKGESVQLPIKTVTDKIGQWSGQVLGKVMEKLPGAKEIETKVDSEKEKAGEVAGAQAIQIIEKQTTQIIEVLKELPQEQLDKIKKEIFTDFCQEVLE